VNVFGVLVNGIDLSILDGSTVQNCTVTTAGSYGIVADSVSNSTAQNTGNSAILANNAINSTGSSNANHGVQVTTAMNCRGTATGASNAGHGIAANTASNCYGTSAGSGNGVDTDGAANSCVGIASGSGFGVHSTHVATNCQGTSNSVGVFGEELVTGCAGTGSTGIFSYTNVSNSYGVGTGTGINCSGAFFSQGSCSSGGTFGIECDMAIGCLGYNTSGYGIYTSGSGSVVAFSLARGSSFAVEADIIYASAVIIPGGSLVGHQYFCGSGANPYP